MELLKELHVFHQKLEQQDVSRSDQVEHENLVNELADLIGEAEGSGIAGYTELYHVVKNMDNRLQRIETMVETVAEEVGPIVAELADSPIIKMLTGGKKRV